MEPSKLKQEAHRVVDELPDDATWEDLMDRIYVRQSIEAGLADSLAGRTIMVADIRARFGARRNNCDRRGVGWC